MPDRGYEPICCIQCGDPIYDEDDVVWVGDEPVVNWPGDPHCSECAPSMFEPDTVEEYRD